jgi:hypothetical protein
MNSAINPYSCGVCGKSFRTRNSAALHERRVHDPVFENARRERLAESRSLRIAECPTDLEAMAVQIAAMKPSERVEILKRERQRDG